MHYCDLLAEGESWDATWSNGTVAGTHDLKGKPHPCAVKYMGGCVQDTCIQGTEAKCHAACDGLQLLPLYNDSCHDHCASGECAGL